MTDGGAFKLRLEMTDFDGLYKQANFTTFKVKGPTEGWQLNVG